MSKVRWHRMRQSDGGSFVRWQQITMSQFGQMNNLLITLAVALLAYYTNLLLEKRILHVDAQILAKVTLVLLMGSIVAGLVCGLSRLAAFRMIAQVAKHRSTNVMKANDLRLTSDKTSWISRLAFVVEVLLFGFGAVVGIATVYYQLR